MNCQPNQPQFPTQPSALWTRRSAASRVLAILLLIVFVCINSTSLWAADGAGVIAVEVETLQKATSWETRSTYSGIVKAKRKSDLSFERPGAWMKYRSNKAIA